MGEPRDEFIRKSQAFCRGESERLDGDEAAELQSKIDACTDPRERFVLRSRLSKIALGL